MFNPTGVLARGMVALSGSDAEKQLAELLYEDNVQVISSLELNQMASYTYHERPLVAGQKDLCEKILDMIEAVLSKPMDHSTLTVHKTLVVLKHILIYGAEKVMTAAVYLGAYVEPLMEYNTAIMAQQSDSITGMFLRFKGGAVDKGGPVRQVATELHALLTNRSQLLYERSVHADPNSLVPVGERNKAAFATDEARLEALQRSIQRERQMLIKSNLAKSSSAFGSGYTGKDGKSVVGAAHGLDVMIKMAQKEQSKFSDDKSYRPPGSEAADALAAAQAAANIQDLLSLQQETNAQQSQPQHQSARTQSVDLLDFGADVTSGSSAPPTTTNATEDLLGTSAWDAAAAAATPGSDIFGDMPTTTVAPMAIADPFAFAMAPPAPTAKGQPVVGVKASIPAQPPVGVMAGPADDRFAALDALASSSDTMTPPFTPGLPQHSTMGTTATAAAPLPDVGRLTDLSGLSLSATPGTAPPVLPNVNTSSIQVHRHVVDDSGDDGDNAFVMGGTVGAGLQPLGPAPAAPPPPPPAGGGLW